jgi:sugar lactone lactonase YvrE
MTRASAVAALAGAVAIAATAVAVPPALDLRVAGEIPLAPAAFAQPVAIAAAPFGRVFVADAGRGQVARVNAAGGIVYTFEVPADQPALSPLDLEVTGFQVFVIDAHAAALLRFSDRGQFLDVLRNFRDAGTETPRALAVDGAGRILLSEPTRHWARLVDEGQSTETIVGGFGAGTGELSRPLGVAFAPGGAFYVADTARGRIQHFSSVGNFQGSVGDSLGEPRGMAVGDGGELFVADARRESVHLYSDRGQRRAELRLPGRQPVDVSVVGDTLWILVTHPAALLRAHIERQQAQE